MRWTKPLVGMMLVVVLGASSCGSRDSSVFLPPAPDRRVDAEPQYPVAALEPCPTNLRSDPCPAETAEREWWRDLLLWGRTHRDRVARVCVWGRALKQDVPAGWCDGTAQ